MSKSSLLYGQLLEITEDYLGPAAENFIDRQIENHLGKDPQKLTKEDLRKLNEWLRISIALLTDDDEIIESFSTKIHKLLVTGASKSELVNKYN